MHRIVVAMRSSRAWERYAWVAGIVFVIALVAEAVVATGLGLSQSDSAATIARVLYEHRERPLLIAYLSVVCKLHNLFSGDNERGRILASSVLVGGVRFVALHAVSDIGITGLLGGKLAAYGASTTRASPTRST